MSTIDLTKVAGIQAVDNEGKVIGTLSVNDLTELVASNLVESTRNQIAPARSASLMSEASTLAATDEYEDQLPQDANPAFVRTLDSSGNPKQTAIASLASVVGGLLPVASSSNKGLMDEIIYQNTVMSKTDNKITDMDTLTTGYYGIHKSIMINNSSGIDYGALFCITPPIGGNAVGANVCVQIAFDYYNNAVKTRVQWLNSWSAWKELSFK